MSWSKNYNIVSEMSWSRSKVAENGNTQLKYKYLKSTIRKYSTAAFQYQTVKIPPPSAAATLKCCLHINASMNNNTVT